MTDSDEGKAIKVKVSFTDDADHEETLTSAATAAVAAKPNSPATGAPTIDGTAQVGETLTALANGITDEDGLDDVSYSYQWVSNDGTTDTDISGQTGSTYTLVSADGGKTIKVRVGFTDDANNSETLTSEATATVPTTDEWWADMLVVDYGTGAIGAASADLFSNSGGNAGLQAKWLWYYSPERKLRLAFTDNVPSISDLTLLVGDVALALQGGDATFTWEDVDVDWEDGQTLTARIVRDWTSAVVALNSPATGAPTIDGTAQVGETLTADVSGVNDADGLDDVSYSYQWVSNDGTTDTDIQDATDSTYTLTDSDEGKAIKVKVSFTDDADHEETLTSAATAAVAAKPNSPATGAPTIDGTAQVGETLTALANGITDEDGLDDVSYSYQWVSNDGTTDTDIQDATDSAYTLTDSDEGKAIKVKVSFTDDAGHEETLTSAATAAVAAKPNSPATGLPAIGGTPQVGETLTADTSGITDADGLTNVSYSYQWIRSDNGAAADIGGQTASTYTLADSDAGKTIKVRVSFTDDADHEETLTSAATDTVAATKPGVPGHPKVFPHDAEALDVYWEAPASDGGSDITGYKVQWKESADSWETPADVSEATASGTIHTITGLTDGVEYSVRVLTTNGVGDSPPSVEQTGTPRETKAPEMVRPRVDGATLKVLYDEALDEGSAPPTDSFDVRVACTCDDTTWLDEEAKRAVESVSVDGDMVVLTLVSAATSEDVVVVSYTPPSDAATARTRDLAGNAAAGFSATQTLNDTEEVPRPNSPATGLPTISGTAQVGQILTAYISGISDDDGLTNVSYSYQWIAGGSDIAGATGSSYTLKDVQKGQTIQVRVSFRDDADNDETLTSDATATVVGPPLTVRLVFPVAGHHGASNVFTFDIRFSEEFPLSYKTLRDLAFTVSGGEVLKAQRLDKPSNIKWRIMVRPDSSEDVTIVLPATTDCEAQGAICTEDGRKLSNRLEFTVSGSVKGDS